MKQFHHKYLHNHGPYPRVAEARGRMGALPPLPLNRGGERGQTNFEGIKCPFKKKAFFSKQMGTFQNKGALFNIKKGHFSTLKKGTFQREKVNLFSSS